MMLSIPFLCSPLLTLSLRSENGNINLQPDSGGLAHALNKSAISLFT